jgi:hypothetical protein
MNKMTYFLNYFIVVKFPRSLPYEFTEQGFEQNIYFTKEGEPDSGESCINVRVVICTCRQT